MITECKSSQDKHRSTNQSEDFTTLSSLLRQLTFVGTLVIHNYTNYNYILPRDISIYQYNLVY